MRNQSSFDQLLERSLQELDRTGDVETVLQRHPEHASQLRPLLEIALETNHYYADIPEPPRGLTAGRQRFLEAAAQQQKRAVATAVPTPREERSPKMRLAFATKLLSALLAIVIGTATIGGGVALAADDSLPGDVLYPAKLAVENVRLRLASTATAQVKLSLQLAGERLEEMEALANRQRAVPHETIARMEEHIYRAMNQAAWASEEEMPGLLEQIAQRTQTQAQTMEQLKSRTQGQNRARLTYAQQVCQQAHQEATGGMGQPDTFRSRYQHRDGMPDEMMPPDPPEREPGGPGKDEGGAQGGSGQQQGQTQDGDQQQDRDRQQDQMQDGEQQQDRDRQQDQTQDGEPQQDRDQQQNQDGSGGPSHQGSEGESRGNQDQQGGNGSGSSTSGGSGGGNGGSGKHSQ